MTEKLMIVFVGTNTLIGEFEMGMSIGMGGGQMKKPRAIVSGANPQGQPVIGLQPLIGHPEEIEIILPLLMYELTEKKLINIYIQSTTGIIPAEGLPPGILMGGRGGQG